MQILGPLGMYFDAVVVEDFFIFIQIGSGHTVADDKFHGKYSGFVDSGFVKTCHELVIG